MKRAISILMFVLLIIGFHHEKTQHKNHHTFHLMVDNTFTIEEYHIIEAAAKRWELASKGVVSFSMERVNKPIDFDPSTKLWLLSVKGFVPQTTDVFVWNAKNTDPELTELEQTIGFSILGFSPGPFLALTTDRMSPEEMSTVTMHELGHVIGLKHTRSIMTSDSNSDCISEIDMYQFCNVYGCKLGTDTNPECR